jgi:coenzyme Q-binding protein COQ10
MAQANRVVIFDAPVEKVYQAITDYESYPDFVEGVSGVRVIESSETQALVEYSLNFIKTFNYCLRMQHTPLEKVEWHLESGDLFKQNQGYWKFKDLGDGRTEVEYNLELDVKMFAPKALVNKLATQSLPAMLESYHRRARSL